MTTEIRLIEKPKLNEPIVVCGLPGGGGVAKLAADHLIVELKAKLFAEIYSYSFPPQVLIKPDGSADLIRNELYYWKNPASENDLIIYTGDSQPASSEAEYEVADKVLEAIQSLGAKSIITMASYMTGVFVDRPKVYGTATDASLLRELETLGVLTMKEGGVTGMNGLLVGIAKIRGMKGFCILGETSGYIIDPKAAQAVLEAVTKKMGISVDMKSLEERVRETEMMTKAFRDVGRRFYERAGPKGSIGYIS